MSDLIQILLNASLDKDVKSKLQAELNAMAKNLKLELGNIGVKSTGDFAKETEANLFLHILQISAKQTELLNLIYKICKNKYLIFKEKHS